LKQNGWTDIIGTWTWDKTNNCLKVDGVAEVVNPALDSDVSVRVHLLIRRPKIRVLSRVERAPPPTGSWDSAEIEPRIRR